MRGVAAMLLILAAISIAACDNKMQWRSPGDGKVSLAPNTEQRGP